MFFWSCAGTPVVLLKLFVKYLLRKMTLQYKSFATQLAICMLMPWIAASQNSSNIDPDSTCVTGTDSNVDGYYINIGTCNNHSVYTQHNVTSYRSGESVYVLYYGRFTLSDEIIATTDGEVSYELSLASYGFYFCDTQDTYSLNNDMDNNGDNSAICASPADIMGCEPAPRVYCREKLSDSEQTSNSGIFLNDFCGQWQIHDADLPDEHLDSLHFSFYYDIGTSETSETSENSENSDDDVIDFGTCVDLVIGEDGTDDGTIPVSPDDGDSNDNGGNGGSGGGGNDEEGSGDTNVESSEVTGEMITYMVIIGVVLVIVIVLIVVSIIIYKRNRKNSKYGDGHISYNASGFRTTHGGSVHHAMAMDDGNDSPVSGSDYGHGGISLNSSNIGIDVVENDIIAQEIERRRNNDFNVNESHSNSNSSSNANKKQNKNKNKNKKTFKKKKKRVAIIPEQDAPPVPLKEKMLADDNDDDDEEEIDTATGNRDNDSDADNNSESD